MDDATPPPTELLPEPVDDQREAAYVLWAWRLDGNAAEVGRDLGIPPRTVQRWASEGNWKARHAAERRSLGRRAWAAAELRMMSVVDDILAAQIKIATGEGDRITTLTRRGEVVEVDYPVPYQARVNAQNSLLDRLGLVAGARPPAGAKDERDRGADRQASERKEAGRRGRQRLERQSKGQGR